MIRIRPSRKRPPPVCDVMLHDLATTTETRTRLYADALAWTVRELLECAAYMGEVQAALLAETNAKTLEATLYADTKKAITTLHRATARFGMLQRRALKTLAAASRT